MNVCCSLLWTSVSLFVLQQMNKDFGLWEEPGGKPLRHEEISLESNHEPSCYDQKPVMKRCANLLCFMGQNLSRENCILLPGLVHTSSVNKHSKSLSDLICLSATCTDGVAPLMVSDPERWNGIRVTVQTDQTGLARWYPQTVPPSTGLSYCR